MAISRSENMRRVKGKNTRPEISVRKMLRELGFSGYRLHRKDLPGTPDIAYIGRRKAILIHGCFWHGHDCKHGERKPKSNSEYWFNKIERNKQRDVMNLQALSDRDWKFLVIWECEIKGKAELMEQLKIFMSS